jgi:hypothetical protein
MTVRKIGWIWSDLVGFTWIGAGRRGLGLVSGRLSAKLSDRQALLDLDRFLARPPVFEAAAQLVADVFGQARYFSITGAHIFLADGVGNVRRPAQGPGEASRTASFHGATI